MTVWIATIDHEFGTNVHCGATIDDLRDEEYEYVKEWWEKETDEPFPNTLPKSEAIDQYFADNDDEFLTESEVTVRGKVDPNDT